MNLYLNHSLKRRSLLLIMLSLSSVNAWSNCNRADVEYYRGEGFSHEQTILLCADNAPAAPQQNNSQPNWQDSPGPINQGYQTNNSNVDYRQVELLKTAISAFDVVVGNSDLSYTLKYCVKFGQADVAGFRNEVCPHVRFTIARKDLAVTNTESGFFFFGTDEVEVTGNIKRKALNMSKYKSQNHEAIKAGIEKGSATKIPVRSGIPLFQVEQALKSLST